MSRLAYISILLLALSANLFAAVEAEIETDKGFRTLQLISLDEGELAYRPPDAPEGVQASLQLDRIRSATFDIEFDGIAVFEAERRHEWVRAALIILKSTSATLPFLSLPDNNAVEPVYTAGSFLERAAHKLNRSGDADRARVVELYDRADRVLSAVAAAEWNYLSEPAHLKSIGCRIMLGDLKAAEGALAKARLPEPYDGAYGQYWLTKGRLLLAQGEPRAACAALAKTVIFDSKNVEVFPDALLLFGKCHEEIIEYHRARDIYYELGRLFPRTEWGRTAIERLRHIMDSGLTADQEKANVTKVFFGVEEDMNAKSKEFLERVDEIENESDREGNQ